MNEDEKKKRADTKGSEIIEKLIKEGFDFTYMSAILSSSLCSIYLSNKISVDQFKEYLEMLLEKYYTAHTLFDKYINKKEEEEKNDE